jgi:hypothetical protein
VQLRQLIRNLQYEIEKEANPNLRLAKLVKNGHKKNRRQFYFAIADLASHLTALEGLICIRLIDRIWIIH